MVYCQKKNICPAGLRTDEDKKKMMDLSILVLIIKLFLIIMYVFLVYVNSPIVTFALLLLRLLEGIRRMDLGPFLRRLG